MNLSPADLDLATVREVPILWISGSALSDEPSRSTVKRVLAARARRRRTVLDLDWRPFWQARADGGVSSARRSIWSRLPLGTKDECEVVAIGTREPERAASLLLERGVELAVVKLGGDGVFVATSSGAQTLVPPVPVEVVYGLGAGDAFGEALCHGLLSGMDAGAPCAWPTPPARSLPPGCCVPPPCQHRGGPELVEFEERAA